MVFTKKTIWLKLNVAIICPIDELSWHSKSHWNDEFEFAFFKKIAQNSQSSMQDKQCFSPNRPFGLNVAIICPIDELSWHSKSHWNDEFEFAFFKKIAQNSQSSMQDKQCFSPNRPFGLNVAIMCPINELSWHSKSHWTDEFEFSFFEIL